MFWIRHASATQQPHPKNADIPLDVYSRSRFINRADREHLLNASFVLKNGGKKGEKTKPPFFSLRFVVGFHPINRIGDGNPLPFVRTRARRNILLAVKHVMNLKARAERILVSVRDRRWAFSPSPHSLVVRNILRVLDYSLIVYQFCPERVSRRCLQAKAAVDIIVLLRGKKN